MFSWYLIRHFPHNRYQANDYYLKELIVEWCEGVLSSGNGNRDFYDLDLNHNSKESFNLLLEKVATFLQEDVGQNEIVDARGLSKVIDKLFIHDIVFLSFMGVKHKKLHISCMCDMLNIIPNFRDVITFTCTISNR
jgi:hypothetical protein